MGTLYTVKMYSMWKLFIIFFPVFVSLQQVDENRKTVANEIKKSICNLIMEINRKGKLLVNQLEVVSNISSSSRAVLPNCNSYAMGYANASNKTKWHNWHGNIDRLLNLKSLCRSLSILELLTSSQTFTK